MARDRIIHLHNSQATGLTQVTPVLTATTGDTGLSQGELAVVNSETYQAILHLNHDGSALVEYIPKTAVESLIAAAVSEIEGEISTGITTEIEEIQNTLEAVKVEAADNSITVTPGATGSTGNTTTKIAVKIKANGGLVMDASGLSVDSKALTPYVGQNAIAVATGDSQNTISLTIAASEQVLSQDTSGLKSTLAITKLSAATEGYLASYQLQGIGGAALGATIDIPKDFLVKSAELKEVEAAETPYSGAKIGDKYIDFTINSKEGDAQESHVYLPVNDLVDVYTGGNGITVNGSNVISLNIKSGDPYLTVTADGLQIKEGTGGTGTNAIDDKIEEKVEAAKTELEESIAETKSASVIAVTADTASPISAATATAETGNTVTLSLKLAEAADMAAVIDGFDQSILENRLKVTTDGKLYVSNIINGGTF